MREGLARGDREGVRRSCTLMEAIWPDVPLRTRAEVLALAADGGAGMEGLARIAIREGDADLAARITDLPLMVLQDLGHVPTAVTRAICGRDDFEAKILPRLAAQPESARVAVAELYPDAMPEIVRDTLLATVRQGDSALGDAMANREDRFTSDLAEDLAALPPRIRIARLLAARREVRAIERPLSSPLLDTLADRLVKLADTERSADALRIVAHLMKVPVGIALELAEDEDPLRIALALNGICLAPSLSDPLRRTQDWQPHAGRDIVEGDLGYALGRRFVADLRRTYAGKRQSAS